MSRKAVVILFFSQLLYAEPVIISNEDTEAEIAKLSEEELLQKVFGTNRQQKNATMTFSVTLDGEKVGDVVVIIEGNKKRIFANTLKEMLAPYLIDNEVKQIDKGVDSDGFISFEKLSFLNFKTEFNLATLDVAITVPPEKKKTRNLNGKPEEQSEKLTVQPALISGILNLRISHSQAHNRTTSNHTDLVIGPSINISGIVLEGAGTFNNITGTDKRKFHRDYLSLVYDFPHQPMTFRAGDVFSVSQGYCSVPRLWGVSLKKEAATSNSATFNSDLQITLLRKSKIEVYVNGVLVRERNDVAPGTYVMNDIPYIYGKNDVQIKITDDTGKVSVIDASGFLDSSLVAPGKFSLNLAGGYPESSSENSRYDKKNFTLSAATRIGLPLASDILVGILHSKQKNAETLELRNSNILGNFTLKYGVSAEANTKRKGHAKGFSYNAPNIALFDKVSLYSGISYENVDNFDTSSHHEEEDRSLLRHQPDYSGKYTTTSYHIGLSNLFGTNFSFNHEIRRKQGEEHEQRYAVSISRSFSIDSSIFNSLSLYVSMDKIKRGSKYSKSFSLGGTLSLQGDHTISSGYSKNDGKNTQYVSYSGSCLDNSLYYSLNHNRSNTKSTTVNLNYYNSMVSANLSHTVGSSSSRSTHIGAETNLFFADGKFAVSKNNPYDGGFVIVSPGKLKRNIKLNSGTESNIFGGAVITTGHHSINHSAIDTKSLPDNIEIKDGNIVSYGEYKRGAVKEIDIGGTYVAKGYLLDKQHRPLGLIAGYAIKIRDKKSEPVVFFTNADGRMILSNLELGKYRVSTNLEGMEDFEIEIKPCPNNIQELGDIICEGNYDQDE